MILDPIDHKSLSEGPYSGNEGAEELRSMIATKGLRDTLQEHEPNARVFTRRDPRTFSYTRLDRWYTSSGTEYQYSAAKDLSWNGSDHDAISLQIDDDHGTPRGPGRIRVDHRVLYDPKFSHLNNQCATRNGGTQSLRRPLGRRGMGRLQEKHP